MFFALAFVLGLSSRWLIQRALELCWASWCPSRSSRAATRTTSTQTTPSTTASTRTISNSGAPGSASGAPGSASGASASASSAPGSARGFESDSIAIVCNGKTDVYHTSWSCNHVLRSVKSVRDGGTRLRVLRKCKTCTASARKLE